MHGAEAVDEFTKSIAKLGSRAHPATNQEIPCEKTANGN